MNFHFFIKMTHGTLYGKSKLDTCLYLRGTDVLHMLFLNGM